MILITIKGEDFEQDIRPLFKAFYPDEEFMCRVDPCASPEDNNTAEGNAPEASKKADSREIAADFIIEPSKFAICFDREPAVSENVELAGVPENDKHKVYRNQLLRALYRILSKSTGKELPWGILTGVRPTKLILELLEAGRSGGDIREHMLSNYYVSQEKLVLGYRVAKRETTLLREMDYTAGYSLYIGIPFCPTICNYCSFGSHPIGRNAKLVEPYLEALKKEIAYAATCFPDRKLQTVYFGGGTPTSISAEQLRDIIRCVKEHFDMSTVVEFTVEAGRPDSITYDKLKMLREEGIGRISINPQTMVQRTLDVIGRRHTTEQIVEAFHMARELGFDNINMDLIIGLTGETPEDVEYTLSEIEKLDPDSLTVHTLAIKRAARLNTERELYEGMQATDVLRMQELTTAYAEAHGYSPYYMYRLKNMAENLENVGYSKPGRECLYNILIMEEKQIILALGAGGSSKFVFESENRFERVENVKGVKEYIERIDEMIERKRSFLEEHRRELY